MLYGCKRRNEENRGILIVKQQKDENDKRINKKIKKI